MKKILSILLIGCISLVQAGGVWDLVKNTASDGIINPKQYEIETSGVNNRAYVFYVKEMRATCVLTYGGKYGTPAIYCVKTGN